MTSEAINNWIAGIVTVVMVIGFLFLGYVYLKPRTVPITVDHKWERCSSPFGASWGMVFRAEVEDGYLYLTEDNMFYVPRKKYDWYRTR